MINVHIDSELKTYLNTGERCIMESSVEEVISFDIDHSQEKIANAPPLKNSP